MQNEVLYYLYTRMIKDKNYKMNKKIVNDAVRIYGFENVYKNNNGCIKTLKLYSEIDKKIIQNSGLLSQRSIEYIYYKNPYEDI